MATWMLWDLVVKQLRAYGGAMQKQGD